MKLDGPDFGCPGENVDSRELLMPMGPK